MTIEVLRSFFGWCALINIGILLWWFLIFALAHDWVYKVHKSWFKLTVDKFDTIHYSGIAFYKISIFIFNLAPYLALYIIK